MRVASIIHISLLRCNSDSPPTAPLPNAPALPRNNRALPSQVIRLQYLHNKLMAHSTAVSFCPPQKTGFTASEHRLINVTLLTLVPLVLRGVADLYP